MAAGRVSAFKATKAVEATGANPERHGIAVAVDGEVVPRAQWDETTISDGQRIEVVQAVQGG